MGFVFAGVFLWLARPTWRTMLFSLLLVIAGLWLRGYAAGYVKKNAELTQTEPVPQTIYRLTVKPEDTLLFAVPLRFTPPKP